MTDAPRNAVSFKDADPIWKAIFAWSQKPHGDHECGAILDAVGALTMAVRLEALEGVARMIEDRAYTWFDEKSRSGDEIGTALEIATAIRERAKA